MARGANGTKGSYHHLAALQRAIGVTRVARVTGLDSLGVEVACAVRPGGHVLQVSNGKGHTAEAARASALHEAAELWAAEQVPDATLSGSRDELLERGLRRLEPEPTGALRLHWVRGEAFSGGAEVWVPLSAVHCLPAGAAPLGPAAVRWTSNGMGAHLSLERALEHALLEAWEREALVQTLPEGWEPGRVAQRRVQGPEFSGCRLAAFDLTPRGARVPVAGVLLHEKDAPVGLTAGYAARPTLLEAIDAAALEAAQSRLTDIHGAREDVATAERDENADVLDALFAIPTRKARARAAQKEPAWIDAVFVELVPGRLPVHVVKVFVPGYRVSELLS